LFDENDTDENIVFLASQPGEDPKPKVRGGTLEKLIERLTHPSENDPQYLLHFLLTYRSFTDPKELLAILSNRYNMPKRSSETEVEFEQKNANDSSQNCECAAKLDQKSFL